MSYQLPSLVQPIDPETQEPLQLRDGVLVDSSGRTIAPVVGDIPRFVRREDNYAESFGWQWKQWADNQSESRGASIKQRQLILDRTHFGEYPLEGKTILECGMGGGDDTEVLIGLPFGEVHSFDLSTAVERAQKHLVDPRLFLSQASIYAIPYPDASFDFVYCHRVLQHTPDPEKSLRAICKKVKPDGVLFIHSYKRSKQHMSEWRYKYRWLTKRVPKNIIYWYVTYLGSMMHYLVHGMSRLGNAMDQLAYRWIPFYKVTRSGAYVNLSRRETIEMEKMITFDALTPMYDSPMATDELKRILGEEGFQIEHLEDRFPSPVYATARKKFTP